MKTSLTTISAKQWDFITSENLTASEAVDFLKNGMGQSLQLLLFLLLFHFHL